jgi:nucleoside-diphosphate-sugar epimerase
LRKTFEKHTKVDGRLDFVNADLGKDAGWSDAVHGCTYVLHVASPFPSQPPKHEDDLIAPAREGTLRILKAAAMANIKRVVMTSSLAAVIYGHVYDSSKVFDENDWSRTDADIGAYEKSKTLAERAAWDFVNSLKGDDKLELAVINPGMVLGPILDNHYSTSGEVVRRLMRREYPGCPKLNYPTVDVRDVATAHIAAMTTPEANGKRFCCAAENAWMREIAEILNNHFSNQGYKIPTRELPNFLVRFVALFDKTVRLVVSNLGQRSEISNKFIKKVLDWNPRSLEEMVVAMGKSMIEHGIV